MSEITAKSDDQKSAEAEVQRFRDDLGPFVVAADTTRMPMVFTDASEAGNPIVFANDSFLALTGYAREEVLGKGFNFMMALGADPTALAQVEAAFAGDAEGSSEIRYCRKDGSIFWAAVFVTPVHAEDGAVAQHFASFVDLTAHKQEQALSAMLIDELNHRVKNTLSTVQSIVWQALRMPSDPETIRESIESRLFALSRSHDLLTRENWEGAALLDVVKDALAPFGVANGRAERFVIAGPEIRCQPKVALALGIAFHELATNAVKYGAFSNEEGTIRLDWTMEPGPAGKRLVLRWEEMGGPAVSPPIRRGFGSRIIERGLAHELEGAVRLEFLPTGVRCTIDIPAPRGTRDG